MEKSKLFFNPTKDIIEEFEKETEKPTEGTALNIVDMSLAYNHMFSPAAKLGMSRKIKDLNPEREIDHGSTQKIRTRDKVEYFAALVSGEEKIVKAARRIAEYINKLASKGYITGCLAPISALNMLSQPHELQKYAVMCFVAVTEDGSKMIATDKPIFLISEGDLPNMLPEA